MLAERGSGPQVDPLNKEADALRALIGRETSAQTQFEGAIEARDTKGITIRR